MRIYRDGIEEVIDSPIKVKVNRAGHTIEEYSVKGQKRFFVTLKGLPYCAHGATLPEAIAAAIWKDPSRRPSLEKLKGRANKVGKNYKFSLMEFRTLTGACQEGCRLALERAGIPMSAKMTAQEICDKVSREWGERLIRVLE